MFGKEDYPPKEANIFMDLPSYLLGVVLSILELPGDKIWDLLWLPIED